MKTKLEVFERRRIDPHLLWGVIVAESDELILIHRVDDFLFDGYQVLRRRDVTRRYEQESDLVYASIMRKEGLWKNPSKSVCRLPVRNWNVLFTALMGKTVVVENERAGDFCIGPVIACGDNTVSIHYFSPSGEWEDVRQISLRRMTSMHFADRYSTLYARHLPPRPGNSSRKTHQPSKTAKS